MGKMKWLWIVIAVVIVLGVVIVNITRQAGNQAQAVQLARVRVEDITSRVRARVRSSPRRR
jgi:hypothetical protein